MLPISNMIGHLKKRSSSRCAVPASSQTDVLFSRIICIMFDEGIYTVGGICYEGKSFEKWQRQSVEGLQADPGEIIPDESKTAPQTESNCNASQRKRRDAQ